MAEYDSVIPAGSSGTLSARMSTGSTQSGRVSKSIGVVTDDAAAREIRLRFAVELYMPVMVKPSPRLAITLVEGSSAGARLLLSRDDGQALRIVPPELGTEGLSVSVRAAGAEPGAPAKAAAAETSAPWGQARRGSKEPEAGPGDVWLELRAAPVTAPGVHSGTLRVATNHPDAPELELPYAVRVRPMLEAHPEAVRLWATAPSNDPGRSLLLTLRHNGDRAFSIAGVEVSHPELFSAVPTPQAEGTRQMLRVRLADGLEGDSLGAGVRGWIRVTTDDGEHPGVEVPVLVAPSRAASRRPVRAPQGTPVVAGGR